MTVFRVVKSSEPARLLSGVIRRRGDRRWRDVNQATDGRMLKAFALCNSITDNPSSQGQKDLQGAGLYRMNCAGPFPIKLSFWVFVQLSDQKETGEARLALMRADSGRRYFFRPINIRHPDLAQATVFCVRLYDCTFPGPGVYFLELWYDDAWVVDQRLELSERGVR